jgi:hypothetical protein
MSKPVYNTAGTHVFMAAPDGAEWECPAAEDVVAFHLARGFSFVEPRDKSWDGLYDLYDPKVADEKVAAAKKAAPSKSNTTSGD